MILKTSLTLVAFLLLVSSAFAVSIQSTHINSFEKETPVLVQNISPIDPVLKNKPTTTTAQPPTVVADKPVGSWMTLFLMHNKWNPETKKWEKKILPKSVLRGTYDFKTKTWTKK